MDICLICLRTDRNLKELDIRLSDFHDELCEYAMSCSFEPQYCNTCEHLLRKAYNFRAKCCKANSILTNYKKTKVSKDKLYTLLPPSTLGTWEERNAHLYNYVYDDKPQPMKPINGDQIPPASYPHIKSEFPTNHLSLYDAFPEEEKEIVIQNTATNNVLETKDPLMNVDEIKTEDVLGDLENNVKTYNELDLIGKNKTSPFENLEDKKTRNDVLKKITEIKEGRDSLDVAEDVKTEDVSDVIENSLITVEFLEDSSLNSADDCDSDDFILNENVYNKRKMMKEKKEIPKKKARTKNYGEVDKELGIQEKQSGTLQKSLLELTNISITDDEFASDDNDSKKQTGGKSETKKIVKKIDQGKVRKKRACNGILDIKGAAEETVNKFFDSITKKKEQIYSKKRLKENLARKFESCGELKTSDGSVMDKEQMLHIIDGAGLHYPAKKLWFCVRNETKLLPKALQQLEEIQSKDNEYKTVFEIKYLNTKEEVIEEFEKRKTYDNYINADFKCDMCHQWFKFKKSLEFHMKAHDVKDGDFVCEICKMRFRRRRTMVSHSARHKTVFKCKQCPLVTNHRISMVNHYEQHNGVVYRCKLCDVEYRSKSSFASHLTSCCKKERKLVCTRCARTFSRELGLRQHINLKHRDSPPVDPSTGEKCSQCDLTFVTREVFERHLRVSHPDLFGSQGLPRRRQVKRRPPTMPLKRRRLSTCRVCNTKGPNHGWLTLHFKLEHPTVDMSALYVDKTKYLCDICGKGYSLQQTLLDHMNTHTGARPYACDVCPATFLNNYCLVTHKLTHAPPQKPCPKCGKLFRTEGNLYTHMRSHIGDRRFKCPICGKGFLHRGSVKEHVRGVHDNVKRVKKRPLARGTKGYMEEVDSD